MASKGKLCYGAYFTNEDAVPKSLGWSPFLRPSLANVLLGLAKTYVRNLIPSVAVSVA